MRYVRKSFASGGFRGCGELGMRFDELPNRADDEALLLFAQLGEDRQGDRLASGGFGLWKIAVLVSQVAKAWLEVKRDRVVDFGTDLARGQVFAERVSQRGGNADDKLVKDVVIPVALSRQADRAGQAQFFEKSFVPRSGFAAIVRPSFEVAQLDAKHGGLKCIEPRVEAHFMMVILGLHPVHAQPLRVERPSSVSFVTIMPESPKPPRFFDG